MEISKMDMNGKDLLRYMIYSRTQLVAVLDIANVSEIAFASPVDRQ